MVLCLLWEPVLLKYAGKWSSTKYFVYQGSSLKGVLSAYAREIMIHNATVFYSFCNR